MVKTAKCKLCPKDIAADYSNNLRWHIESKLKSKFENLNKHGIEDRWWKKIFKYKLDKTYLFTYQFN